MTGTDVRSARGLGPLLVVSAVVVLVAFGQARGLWLSNLHNGLLAVAFTLVGAYVLYQRPGHHEGQLFLATGVVEAVLFCGRQIGHSPVSDGSRWWGWFGVWPTAVALALTTLAIVCFPDGRLPARGWQWVIAPVSVIVAGCAACSAIWPVEYGSTGVITAYRFNASSPQLAADLWSAIAHPAYVGCQTLWIIAIAARWPTAKRGVRRQLAWLVAAAGISVIALVIGLLVSGTPRLGLLTAALVPVAAGWAIVHGQQVAAYSALTWLSRTSAASPELATDLVRAVAEALNVPGSTLWMGADTLHAVGVWPETDDEVAPTTLEELRSRGEVQLRVVTSRGKTTGAISIDRLRSDPLSVAEGKLFDDLAFQASLVIDHIGLIGLGDAVALQQQAGRLDGLSEREGQVLQLMARGRSNAAICDELHLSIKTVEPIISTIFSKLGLHADAAHNRRVLAVLTYYAPEHLEGTRRPTRQD